MLLGLRSLWESSVTPPTLPNAPGRVIKGEYPYWVSEYDSRPPYWKPEEERALQDEEEILAMMGIEL